VQRIILNTNNFSNIPGIVPKLDVNYLTGATGGSSAEGSKIMQQMLFDPIQKEVIPFNDICNLYSLDNFL
jgi:hypothetical protein